MQLSDDKQQQQQYLELSYGGAALQDCWALCDVGITSGSAIRCLIKVLKHEGFRDFGGDLGRAGNTIRLREDAEAHLCIRPRLQSVRV